VAYCRIFIRFNTTRTVHYDDHNNSADDNISKLICTARRTAATSMWPEGGGGVVYNIFYTAQVDDNEMEIRYASVFNIDVMYF